MQSNFYDCSSETLFHLKFCISRFETVYLLRQSILMRLAESFAHGCKNLRIHKMYDFSCRLQFECFTRELFTYFPTQN